MSRAPLKKQATRTRRPREERLADILAAARTVFEAKGYAAAPMAEIAAIAGLSEAALYKFYDGKHELVAAVIEEWYHGLIGDIDATLRGIPDPLARLRFIIWRHLKTIKDDPGLCRVVLLEIRANADYRGSPVHDCNRRYSAFLLDTLKEGMSAGVFRNDVSAPLLRDLVYGGIEHHTWDYLSGRKKKLNIDSLADQLFSLVTTGASEATQIKDMVARIEAAAALIQQNAK